MAVKDKGGGFQQFPLAVYDIPPREQIEEASAITQNLLEGHQAVGQGLADPYTHAVHYLEKHRIVEIMQVTMETGPYIVMQLMTLSTLTLFNTELNIQNCFRKA